MCTSIISNRKKTIVGWNLDILDMEHRVRPTEAGVFIEVNDPTEGWMPLFGANARGDFVGMPTCWPFDPRSDPAGEGENVILLDIDLLLQKKTLQEVRAIAEETDNRRRSNTRRRSRPHSRRHIRETPNPAEMRRPIPQPWYE